MLALSFGKPVISIDKAFLRDIITGETGILIPQNNEDALVEALAEASMRRWSSDQIVSHCLKYTFDDAAAVVLNTVR